jgi:hypothetical protein
MIMKKQGWRLSQARWCVSTALAQAEDGFIDNGDGTK